MAEYKGHALAGGRRYIALFITVLLFVISSIAYITSSDSTLQSLCINFFLCILGFQQVIFHKRIFGLKSVLLNPTLYVVICVVTIFGIFPFLNQINQDAIEYARSGLFPQYEWLIGLPRTISLGNIFIASYLISNELSAFRLIKKGSELKHSVSIKERQSNSSKRMKVPWLPTLFLCAYGIGGYLLWRPSALTSQIFTTRKGLADVGASYTNGYLYDSYLVLGGIASALLLIDTLNERRPRTFTIILSILSVLPSYIAGNRSVVLLHLIVFMIIAIHSQKKRNLVKFFIGATIIFPLLIVAPRIFRGENTFSFKNVAEGFSSKEIISTFTGLDSAMLATLSILNERIATNDIELLFGQSYINFFLRPIPRSLMETKPLEIDRILNNAVFPETSRYVGFAFSGLSEPLINFGILGVIVFAAFLGWVNFKSSIIIAGEKPLMVMVCVWWIAFQPLLIRGNLTTDLPRILFPLIPSLIIINVSTKLADKFKILENRKVTRSL